MYNDPVITKYINLIKTATGSLFKGVYQGDPFRIPKSNLPALVVSKSETNVSTFSNSEDRHEMALTITIVTDIRDERSDEQSMAPGIAQLYDIIEGRENTTYKLKTASILNILRTNQVVDATYNLRTNLGSVTKADYGLTQGKRTPDGYATEGQIQFIASYSQIR